jgi:signal transduction histidine kinase
MTDSSIGTDPLHVRFVSLLVHDLETPLAVAKQFLRRVEQGRHDPDNPAHQRLLASTQLAVSRAERILEDVLDQARNPEGGLTIHPAATDIKLLLKECIQLVTPLAKEDDQTVSLQEETALPGRLVIDAPLMGRVVDNLLVNALRHAPRNSEVIIKCAYRSGVLVLEVLNESLDAGPGRIEDIFDPVQQVELRTRRQQRGGGLGLTFSRMVAEAHNGRISAHQDDSGRAVFRVEIPAGSVG